MSDPRSEENKYVSLGKTDTGLIGGLTRSDNENTHVRVTDNPLVAEVLSSHIVNINDPRVKVEAPTLQELSLIKDSGDLAQLKLGSVEVLKKDAVSLKDIDVNQIPEHLDVIVTPRQKEVILVGRRVESKGIGEFEESSAESNVADESKLSTYSQKVQPQIFNEKSHQEFQDESTFFFDPKFRVVSLADYVSRAIRSLPLFVLFVCFMTTWLEDLEVDKIPKLLQEQELTELENFRRNQILKMNLQKNRTSLADFLGNLESERSTY